MYELSRKNDLTIDVTTGQFLEDIKFELKESIASSNNEIILFATQQSLVGASYQYEADLYNGPHEICVWDAGQGGGYVVLITYKYTEKEAEKVEITGDLNTCKTFTVEAI